MKLYLDDLRVPNMSHNSLRGLGEKFSNEKDWTIVRDYFQFVEIIKSNINDIELISFDHDLACFNDGVEYTGKDAANFLIEYCLDNNMSFPNWYVHSDNTSGKKNIIGLILNYLKSMEDKDISKFNYYHNGIINDITV